ncbi:hypothetical protein [Kitasatospora sp. NPDC097643]|uniref:hypothetical protein n=1 Tax=Kitasatospora sp. NPDC097643 TaxID=3157230 RepID=UPI00333339F3
MILRSVRRNQSLTKLWQRFASVCSVGVAVGGITATCLTAPAVAGAASTRVTPGHSTARLVIDGSSVTWSGNTVGWSSGDLHLHVRLYWNGALQDDRDQDCFGTTYCSTPTMTRNWLCAGRWTVKAWAEGPGGSSNVDVKEEVVGDGLDPARTKRALCAQPI